MKYWWPISQLLAQGDIHMLIFSLAHRLEETLLYFGAIHLCSELQLKTVCYLGTIVQFAMAWTRALLLM